MVCNTGNTEFSRPYCSDPLVGDILLVLSKVFPLIWCEARYLLHFQFIPCISLSEGERERERERERRERERGDRTYKGEIYERTNS